jgi:hypothetical protein
MMKAQDPALDIQKLTAILNQSAKDVMEAGKDQKTGYGIINAANAYALLTDAAPAQNTANSSRVIADEQGRLLERLGQTSRANQSSAKKVSRTPNSR